MFSELFKNKLVNYVLYIILAFITIYIISKLFNSNSYMEGLENKDGGSIKNKLDMLSKEIDELNNTANEELQLDKYKENYENIIIAYDEYIDKLILQKIMNSNIVKNDKDMKSINETIQLKINLNNVMDSLDKAHASS